MKLRLHTFAFVTPSIRLVRGAGTEKGVLVCHPVFTETEPRRLRGFALLVLRLQTMLHAALEKTGHDRTVVVVDLLQLFPDQEPMIIASSLAGTNPVSYTHLTLPTIYSV